MLASGSQAYACLCFSPFTRFGEHQSCYTVSLSYLSVLIIILKQNLLSLWRVDISTRRCLSPKNLTDEKNYTIWLTRYRSNPGVHVSGKHGNPI
jgi:hypothetical protein